MAEPRQEPGGAERAPSDRPDRRAPAARPAGVVPSPLDVARVTSRRDPYAEADPSELEETLVLARGTLGAFGEGQAPLEVAGRLAAAEALSQRGETGSALRLAEEALVLSKTIHDLRRTGRERVDLFDLRLEQWLREKLGSLLDPDALRQDVAEQVARASQDAWGRVLEGEAFQRAVRALLEQRLEAQLRERAFARAVELQLEAALRAHLQGEEFAAAAAEATAARPDALLDRPETLARIEQGAAERERELLRSTRFSQRVLELVEQCAEVMLDRPELVARLEALAPAAAAQPPDLAALRSDPAFQEALSGASQALLASEPFLSAVDERCARALRPAALADALERALRESAPLARALEEALLQGGLLPAVEQRLLGSAALAERADETARRRCEELLRSRGFSSAVRELAQRAAAEAADARLEQERAGLTAAARGAAQELLGSAGLREAITAQLDPLRSELTQSIQEAAKTAPTRVASALRREPEGRLGEAVAARIKEVLDQELGVSLLTRLEGALLADGGPLRAGLERLVEDVIKRGVDEERVVRLVQKEIANREALAKAAMAGDGLIDQATAVARSDAMAEVIKEHLEAFKQRELQARRVRAGGSASETGPVTPPKPDESAEKPARKLDARSTNKTPRRPAP